MGWGLRWLTRVLIGVSPSVTPEPALRFASLRELAKVRVETVERAAEENTTSVLEAKPPEHKSRPTEFTGVGEGILSIIVAAVIFWKTTLAILLVSSAVFGFWKWWSYTMTRREKGQVFSRKVREEIVRLVGLPPEDLAELIIRPALDTLVIRGDYHLRRLREQELCLSGMIPRLRREFRAQAPLFPDADTDRDSPRAAIWASLIQAKACLGRVRAQIEELGKKFASIENDELRPAGAILAGCARATTKFTISQAGNLSRAKGMLVAAEAKLDEIERQEPEFLEDIRSATEMAVDVLNFEDSAPGEVGLFEQRELISDRRQAV